MDLAHWNVNWPSLDGKETAIPDRPLNATAASLLGFLHHGPMSGWDLAATAQTVIGDFWSLTQSPVYRELTAMAAAGLVEAGEPADPYVLATLEFGLAYERAVLAWFDRLPATLPEV